MVNGYFPLDKLSVSEIKEARARYAALVPQDLQELDEARLRSIPAALASRNQPIAYLEKEELVTLTQWKLKHGTFRPTLLALVRSNEASAVKDCSSRAFSVLDAERYAADSVGVKPAMSVLLELKGVGPATASLILSTYAPDTVPFFSDELFRYCICRNVDHTIDWKAKMKYSKREYEELYSVVTELRDGVDGQVAALDMELAVWAIARDVPMASGGRSKKQGVPAAKAESESARQGESTKRKREIEPQAADGRRRSARRVSKH